MPAWKCLPCIVEHKMAEQQYPIDRSLAGATLPDLPPMRDAITLLNGAPHCYEHIAVQRQSPLTLPNSPGTVGTAG